MTDLLTTPVTADLVRGCLETEQTADGLLPHRLPAWARAQNTDPQLEMAEAQPSGVRVAFHSRATHIELHTMPTKRVYAGAPPRPDGVYELVIDGLPFEGGVVSAFTWSLQLDANTAPLKFYIDDIVWE